LLVQRSPLTEWRILPTRVSGRYWIPMGWAPFITTLVIERPKDGAGLEGDPSRFVQAAGKPESALAVLGGLTLVSVVLGIPFGLGALGTGGFFLAVGTSFAFSTAVTLAAFRSVRSLGLAPRAALRWAAPFLSPFAAPRASEELLKMGLKSMALGKVLEHLLPPEGFSKWLRPLLFDLRHDPTQAEPDLLMGLDLDEMGKALASTDLIEAGATFFCPRCGDSFVRGGRCPDCHVSLAPTSRCPTPLPT